MDGQNECSPEADNGLNLADQEARYSWCVFTFGPTGWKPSWVLDTPAGDDDLLYMSDVDLPVDERQTLSEAVREAAEHNAATLHNWGTPERAEVWAMWAIVFQLGEPPEKAEWSFDMKEARVEVRFYLSLEMVQLTPEQAEPLLG